VAADPRLRPCGHWDRPFCHLVDTKYILGLSFTVPLCDSLKCLSAVYKRAGCTKVVDCL
jgi:hypothetical protein